LDGKSGFSQRFNSPFERNTDTGIVVDGTEYFPNNTDQLQRFDENGFLPNNAFRINTDDDGGFGGFGILQSGITTVFDGNEAQLEIRAKLTAPLVEQAPSVRVVAKDRDGNGTAEAGDFGGEEYHFNIALDQFNESSMTTISLPFSAATVEQAQEFATAGDGTVSDFNLYYLGMLTEQGAGLVDLEVEFVRIVLPPPPGSPGDFDGNGSVGNSDLTLLLNNWGANVPPVPAGWTGAQPTEPGVGNDELTALLNNWGQMAGSGQASASAAVPEPGAYGLTLLGWGMLTAFRRRKQ
jgi:hypothetical protein